MLKKLFAAAGLCLALLVPNAHADISPQAYASAQEAFKSIMTPTTLPAMDDKACFKQFCLGQTLDLTAPSFGFYTKRQTIAAAKTGDTKGERKILCQHGYLEWTLSCSSAEPISAFEQPMNVVLDVLPSALPSVITPVAPNFSEERWDAPGRILVIRLSSENASPQFFKEAQAYFEKTFGAKGALNVGYSNNVPAQQAQWNMPSKNLKVTLFANKVGHVSIDIRFTDKATADLDGRMARMKVAYDKINKDIRASKKADF